MEIGRSMIISESKAGFLVGNITLTGMNTMSELQVRARSGNDTGNIGMGKYYVENSTLFLYHEGNLCRSIHSWVVSNWILFKAPDPPTGLRVVESTNKSVFTLQWQPLNDIHNICGYASRTSRGCNITAYQVTCKSILASSLSVATGEVSIEVPVSSTSVNITRFSTLEKGERYNCSVQARDNCEVLSNYGASIEFDVAGI